MAFLRDELIERRGITKAVLGLSGGIDSARGRISVRARSGSRERSRDPHAVPHVERRLACRRAARGRCAGINVETIEITDAVDGYLRAAGDADPRRRGNVMARMRMLVLFDQSARLSALPIGTGNKTERLMGYFTWHADDTPPVNPIGDLFKTQVWALARHLGVPVEVIDKPPSADLEANQTDEGDMGVTYLTADRILAQILSGYNDAQIAARRFRSARDRPGAEACRRHALEAASADDRARFGHGDQRILPAPRRLSDDAAPPASFRSVSTSPAVAAS